jgi:hypothetical protein
MDMDRAVSSGIRYILHPYGLRIIATTVAARHTTKVRRSRAVRASGRKARIRSGATAKPGCRLAHRAVIGGISQMRREE